MIGVVVSVAAFTGEPAAATIPAQTGFERFKALEGEWVSDLPKGGKAYARYEVVSNGKAVLEHYKADNLPGGGNMITMYHLDGEALMLEHYCIAGAHPRMKAKLVGASAGEIAFELVSVANLSRPGAGHMANARFTFIDADHFTTVWQYLEDGKVKFTESNQYTRVK
jgi:hypothetical protein